jgi:hypothetical protein
MFLIIVLLMLVACALGFAVIHLLCRAIDDDGRTDRLRRILLPILRAVATHRKSS